MTTDPLDDLQGLFAILIGGRWKPTTGKELWEHGLDFYEDERHGRSLELIEEGPTIYVRIIWEQAHLCTKTMRMYVQTFGEDSDSARTITLELTNVG